MIELVFVACLLAAPNSCEEKSLQFIGVSLPTCTVGGQAQLATWAASHPKWKVKRWQCRAANGRAAKV